MAVIGVSMIALIVVTVLIVVGFLFVLSFVGDLFVAAGVVSLALLVVGAGLFVVVSPTITVTEKVVVHDHDGQGGQTIQLGESTQEVKTAGTAAVTRELEPESTATTQLAPVAPVAPADPNTLSTTSGLYATTDQALNDALAKLVVKLDQQMALPKFVPGVEAQMVQILKSEQPNYQVHDTAQDRDLGDGLVAKMHKVTVNFPLDLVEKVRSQMEQWVALVRARQALIALGSAAGAFFLIGAFLSWVSRPAKPARAVGPS
jgi:hypothetical protein